mmetsp:Transcript_53593/g.107627  ORF Transcript_53593/g.107627 Transcript_53593/m.107627 type:complete len:344 (-) Transcript_53593:713-1744(-)
MPFTAWPLSPSSSPLSSLSPSLPPPLGSAPDNHPLFSLKMGLNLRLSAVTATTTRRDKVPASASPSPTNDAAVSATNAATSQASARAAAPFSEMPQSLRFNVTRITIPPRASLLPPPTHAAAGAKGDDSEASSLSAVAMATAPWSPTQSPSKSSFTSTVVMAAVVSPSPVAALVPARCSVTVVLSLDKADTILLSRFLSNLPVSAFSNVFASSPPLPPPPPSALSSSSSSSSWSFSSRSTLVRWGFVSRHLARAAQPGNPMSLSNKNKCSRIGKAHGVFPVFSTLLPPKAAAKASHPWSPASLLLKSRLRSLRLPPWTASEAAMVATPELPSPVCKSPRVSNP